MSASRSYPEIDNEALFAGLADSSSVCVVTPNQRLSVALLRTFANRQSARGLHVWEAADILPLAAFIERLYRDAQYSELAPSLPMLLSSAQELTLWESVIAGSEAGSTLLAVPGTAQRARDAWTLAHAWKLLPSLKDFFGNDDTRVYADWAWRYQGITARDRQTERARLPEWVSGELAHQALRKPRLLVLYGFDIVTPQQADFFAALAGLGVELRIGGPQAREDAALRVAFASAREEVQAAASWARSRLDSALLADRADCRIGIVVPDLAAARESLRREFLRALSPASELPMAPREPQAFNISMGVPLNSYPLVRAALLLLELAAGKTTFAGISRLLRSPFIGGADEEQGARAGLDAALRESCTPHLTLERLNRAIARLTAPDNPWRPPACPLLVRHLGTFAERAKQNVSGARRPGEWARIILQLFDAAGFPGTRTLDSTEYQTLQKLHEAVAEFASLERVAGRMRFTQARARFARLVTDSLFQPQAAVVPVQILGVLESAGLEFDHLWVMGLDDESWPLAARPNPFIPVALQKRAGVPEASAAASLELDRRITRGWRRAAPEVVFSHALRKDDRELLPSPLIRAMAAAEPQMLASPARDSLRALIRAVPGIERVADSRAPAFPPGHASAGGTGVFRDQAACPFRAFAIHRLGARALAQARALDASDRGTLVHSLLAKVWKDLKNSATLAVLAERDRDAMLSAAADIALNSLRWRRPEAIAGRLGQLEKARLIRLGQAWLGFEKQRPPFEVVAIEQKQSLCFGGLTINAKLDRMDQLLLAAESAEARPAGTRRPAWAIIDYKTGSARVGAWLGERPDEPQLPLYAVGSAERLGEGDGVVALAFARVRSGEMSFLGVGASDDLIPGVSTLENQRSSAARHYASWSELLAGLRYELEALGLEFMQGEARVAPKHATASCSHCHLHALCRVNERNANSFGADGEESLQEAGGDE